MGYGDVFSTLGRDFARGNRLDALEHVCRVVAIAALVTDPNHHVLKDHKARFVLEGLPLYPLFSNCPRTVLAPLSKPSRHIYGSVTS